MEFIPSNKGHVKLLYKDFMYTKHKVCGKGVRWRCVERLLNCKGSITTSFAGDLPVMTIPHNHLPDLNSVREAREKGKAPGYFAFSPSKEDMAKEQTLLQLLQTRWLECDGIACQVHYLVSNCSLNPY